MSVINSAFPIVAASGDVASEGLSKHEYFAIASLQGMLSGKIFSDSEMVAKSEIRQIVYEAIIAADALIEILDA